MAAGSSSSARQLDLLGLDDDLVAAVLDQASEDSLSSFASASKRLSRVVRLMHGSGAQAVCCLWLYALFAHLAVDNCLLLMSSSCLKSITRVHAVALQSLTCCTGLAPLTAHRIPTQGTWHLPCAATTGTNPHPHHPDLQRP
jgi:hypothetical protein